MLIPRIIHQMFDKKDSVSDTLLRISTTWKEQNPDWEYKLWGEQAINDFLLSYFPDFIAKYQTFPYNIQRWHVIRYLILFHYGGLYVDMDYECLEPIEELLKGSSCCLGLEPEDHAVAAGRHFLVGNALMASTKKQPFIKYIIDEIFGSSIEPGDYLFNYVSGSTGIKKLNTLYDKYSSKRDILLLSSELISPLSMYDVSNLLEGIATEEMENKVEKAYAVHYHLGFWRIKELYFQHDSQGDDCVFIPEG